MGLEQGNDAAYQQMKEYFTSVFNHILVKWDGSDVGLRTLVNEAGCIFLEQSVLERKAGSTMVEFKPAFIRNLVETMITATLSKKVELKLKDASPDFLERLSEAAEKMRHSIELETISPFPVGTLSFKFQIEDDGLYVVPDIFTHSNGEVNSWTTKKYEEHKIRLG